MNHRTVVSMLGAGLMLTAASGCGNYTITFEVADVINAVGEDDRSREPLDVDIVMLGPDEVEKYPELANGAVRSDEWFEARDAQSGTFGGISPKRIYALRDGADTRRDRLVGPSLASAVDRGGERETTVRAHHPDLLHKESAIVIFGRFRGQQGLAKNTPLVISPLPWWDTHLRVRVGRRDMQLVERD